jgi:hypothetical protein
VLKDAKMKVSGTVQVKLQIQKYRTHIKLLVADLAPGFDVILGDDWGLREQAVTDHGSDTVALNVWLRKSSVRLYPPPRDDESQPETSNSQLQMLNAVQAWCLFKAGPRPGCSAPFVAMIRESRKASHIEQYSRLESLLQKYSVVFYPPNAGSHSNQADI